MREILIISILAEHLSVIDIYTFGRLIWVGAQELLSNKMEEAQYGTDSERYLGSGILKLSRVPRYPYADKSCHLSPRCQKEQAELEKEFKHNICRPWLKHRHLPAEISHATWIGRTVVGQRNLGGIEYPCIELGDQATICVSGNIALLEIARSADAQVLVQMFDELEPQERWWVFDFFCDG